jgi:hypothetical protein
MIFYENYLVNKITSDMKDEVIRLHLQGESRNDIARTCGLSEGTVSNIEDEWKHSLGIPDVQSLRELAVNLKRCGIDAPRCAEGLRIKNTMRKLGVNPNQFEGFINEVYEYCQRIGLAPQDIASNLQALINLSKDIPFSKIPERIEEKKGEISMLDEEIRKKYQEIKTFKETKRTLEMEISLAKDLRDAALENERITSAEIREYSNLKVELRKYGIPIDDLQKLVQLLYEIRQHGYDVKKVLSEYQDLLFIKENRDIVWRQIKESKDEKKNLQNVCSSLEAEVSRHSQRLYTYDELESLGIAIRELRILCNTIREIAAESGKSYRIAIEQFFGWVEKLYGAIKLRQKIQEQEQAEYAKLDNNLTAIYPYYPDIKPFTSLPGPYALEEKERERQRKFRSSIFYSYRKINPKTKEEEESNQSDNDNHDGDIYEG